MQDPDPKPAETPAQPPPLTQRVWNVTVALTQFVADGLRTVSRDEYEARLAVCDDCDARRGVRCGECGCRIAIKAKGRRTRCPLKKWPEVRAHE